MTTDDFRSVTEFEHNLEVGDEVRINWTNCHRFWSGRGILKKINRQSFIVTLSEGVGNNHDHAEGYYPRGQEIKAPRLSMGSGMKLWSCNNRLEPAGGYE